MEAISQLWSNSSELKPKITPEKNNQNTLCADEDWGVCVGQWLSPQPVLSVYGVLSILETLSVFMIFEKPSFYPGIGSCMFADFN